MILHQGALLLADRDSQRYQQRLAAHAGIGQGRFHALVGDPLMGGMHVHHDQPAGALRQDIDAMQLRDGVAQRR